MEETPEPPSRYRKVITWLSNNASALSAGFAITTACLILIVVLQTVELHRRYPLIQWGSVAEAFAAGGTVLAVAVALWQSIVIGRQAKQEGIEAAQRFERELTSARELHAVEMKAADDRHKAELEHQRELARVQRVHLREQEFKLALIRVSRAASAYTHELATLVAETQRITSLSTRQERDDAIKPIAKRMNLASHDLGLEVGGAHMLTNNDLIHSSLDPIMEAATEATTAAHEYENTVIMAGQSPNPLAIYMAMEKVNRVVGDARRLAGELLVTGWD